LIQVNFNIKQIFFLLCFFFQIKKGHIFEINYLLQCLHLHYKHRWDLNNKANQHNFFFFFFILFFVSCLWLFIRLFIVGSRSITYILCMKNVWDWERKKNKIPKKPFFCRFFCSSSFLAIVRILFFFLTMYVCSKEKGDLASPTCIKKTCVCICVKTNRTILFFFSSNF
jgi:hypothetical protein